MKHHFLLFTALLLVSAAPRSFAQKYVVNTLAGTGTQGYADGDGTAAQFYSPFGVATDGAGNVYVADANNNRIRKITADGTVSTLAGSGTQGDADGDGTVAQFYSPFGVATDGAGNVYVADSFNNRIRKITPHSSGTGVTVTTLAGSSYGVTDGDKASAKFSIPFGVATDAAGNVYVADTFNNRIRKITPDGAVSTLAGSSEGYADGDGATAKFRYPASVATDGAGNVYVADQANHRIRKITPDGTVSTLAGSSEGYADGDGATATFNTPSGVATDAAGNVYVGDQINHRIRKITPNSSGTGVTVSTLAGSSEGYVEGDGKSAKFNSPFGVATDGAGRLYVADLYNHRIRKIVPLSCSFASPLAASPGTHVSAIAGADENGWKPYCNNVGELLFSLQVGASGAVVPENGVELKMSSPAASYYTTGTGFVTNPGGAAFFNKTWEVSPTTEPTSAVGVRYYFTQGDYDALNSVLVANSQSPATAMTSMNFYKITDATLGKHPAVSDITSGKVIIIRNGTTPSATNWRLGTEGNGYYAEFQVAGFSGGGGGSGAAGAPLPVTLVTFDATKQEQQVQLAWRTTAERNSDHFEIERSTDGQRWDKIGQVPAAQHSSLQQPYAFTDQQPLPAQNLYRLKMVDLDGSFAYSRICSVVFGEASTLWLYPNPAREAITLNLEKACIGTTAKLTNLSGVTLRQITIRSTSQAVDLQTIAPGLYFLQLQDGRSIKMVRE